MGSTVELGKVAFDVLDAVVCSSSIAQREDELRIWESTEMVQSGFGA